VKLIRDGSVGLITLTLLSSAMSGLAYEVDEKKNQVELESLSDFDACVTDFGVNDYCLDGLKRRADAKPAEAFEAGKKARINYQHWVALYFFEKALSKKADPDRCSDEDVELGVLSGLDLPSSYEGAERAQTVAEKCWRELQPKLIAGLTERRGSYYMANLCPLLTSKVSEPDECKPKPKVGAERRRGDRKVTADILALQDVNWKDLELKFDQALVLQGRGTEQIFVVRAEAPNEDLFAIKLSGISGPWNRRVIVACERSSKRDTEYVTLVDGQEWTLIDIDERYGYPGFTVYPKESEEIQAYRVRLEDRKKVDSRSVASEFK